MIRSFLHPFRAFWNRLFSSSDPESHSTLNASTSSHGLPLCTPRLPSFTFFGKAGPLIFPLERIVWADFSQLETLRLLLCLDDGTSIEVFDIEALELAYQLKPSALEGHRFAFTKGAWTLHNFLGHPLMPLLALFKAYRLAFYVHDVTVPRALTSHSRLFQAPSNPRPAMIIHPHSTHPPRSPTPQNVPPFSPSNASR